MSSIVNIITEEEYNKLVSGTNLAANIDHVIINFGAEWCTSCKMIQNDYEGLTQKYPNIVFAKIDVDLLQDLADKLQITKLPTLHSYYIRRHNYPYSELITKDINEIIKKIDEILLSDPKILDDF